MIDRGEQGELEKLLLVAVRRTDAIEAFENGTLRRAGLEDAINVSRTTAHRILRTLDDHDLIEPTSGGYDRTPLGDAVAETLRDTRNELRGTLALEPFLDALDDVPVELDRSSFADVTVTTGHRGDPYAPVRRFVNLLSSTDRLRAFDTTTIAPIFVDDVRTKILGGMETSVIYPPEVARRMVAAYHDDIVAAIESGNLRLFTNNKVPFRLALFDDRVGLGAYNAETGTLLRLVDTESEAAIDWAERVYDHYRTAADPFDPSTEGHGVDPG